MLNMISEIEMKQNDPVGLISGIQKLKLSIVFTFSCKNLVNVFYAGDFTLNYQLF